MNSNYNSFNCWRCGLLTFEESMPEEDMKHNIKLHYCVHRMKDLMDAYGEVSVPVELWKKPDELDVFLDNLEKNEGGRKDDKLGPTINVKRSDDYSIDLL